MKTEWNRRAKENAFHYISTFRESWDEESFYHFGELQTSKILDAFLSERDLNPSEMVVLEIGCGAGRMTRALSRRFRLVLAYDVSDEMVRLSRAKNGHLKNVTFRVNDGVAFPEVRDESVGFVFCGWTMIHMPTKRVVRSNVKETARVLTKGGWYLVNPQIVGRATKWVRPLKTVATRILAPLRMIDPLTATNTFRGVYLREKEAQMLFEDCGLTMNMILIDDRVNSSDELRPSRWLCGQKLGMENPT